MFWLFIIARKMKAKGEEKINTDFRASESLKSNENRILNASTSKVEANETHSVRLCNELWIDTKLTEQNKITLLSIEV